MQSLEIAASEGSPMDTTAPPMSVGSRGGDISRQGRVVDLVLRLTVAILTVVSLSLIAADQAFTKVTAFNYLLAATIMSFLYSVVQCVIVGYHLASAGKRLVPITFYAYFTTASDLSCAILLLSGSSAAFGVTTGAKSINNFIAQANGSASMAFLAFVFMLPWVVLSSHRLLVVREQEQHDDVEHAFERSFSIAKATSIVLVSRSQQVSHWKNSWLKSFSNFRIPSLRNRLLRALCAS